jgi:hypothetical protein
MRFVWMSGVAMADFSMWHTPVAGVSMVLNPIREPQVRHDGEE